MDFASAIYKGSVKTKFRKPDITSQIVPRLRLHEKLNQTSKQKLTIVSAAAGYGKTTAVLEWLNSQQLQTAWVSLDEKDNESHVFWQYICSALSGIDESIRSDTDYVFSSHELFKTSIHLNILLDKLDSVGTDTFLILDDFHHITEPGILDSLLYFVHYLPPKMHLILISRSEPGMELAHLEVKGQIAWLTADDLRFQHTEISQFYEKRGLYLDDSDLESIEKYSKGWAAALVVVAISLDSERYRSQIKKGILNYNRNLDQYFLEEVYNTWTDEKKTFFLQTSILDSFCDSLCNAVTGYDNNGNLLERLNQGNSFLIPLDEKNGWYKYHPIFQDFLLRRLTDSASDILPDLYMKSAFWYRENGYPRMSIEHYLLGGHYEAALKLIEEQSVLLIDSGDCSSALSWINRLPEVYTQNSLEIAAIQATYYAEIGSFELSKHWVARMESIATGSKYSTEDAKKYAQNGCRLIRAHIFSLEGNMVGVNTLLKTVIESGGSQYNLIKYMDFNPYDIYFYRCPISSLITVFGKRPDIYLEMIGNYQALIQKNPPGYGPLIAGEYLYEKDMLEESVNQLLSAMEKATDAHCPGVLVPSMVTIARIDKARGDIAGALTTIEECESRLQDIHKMHWNYLLKSFKARLLLETGDMHATENWFTSCKLGIYHEISRTREFELLVYARFLIARGRINEAKILLKRLLAFSMGLARKHSTVEILNLLAMASFRNKENEKAMDYLGKSIAIGLEEEYIRSFADEGEPMAVLLSNFTAKEKDQKTYVRSLLKHTAGGIPAWEKENKDSFLPASKQLTRQEYKVLQLLSNGYTNQQISDQLNISISTTKIHLGNIYGKLQVTTRIQCINQARKLGLIW